MIQSFELGYVLGLMFGLIGGLVISCLTLKPLLDSLEFKLANTRRNLRNLEIMIRNNERRFSKNDK